MPARWAMGNSFVVIESGQGGVRLWDDFFSELCLSFLHLPE